MKSSIRGNWKLVPVLSALIVAGACGDQMGQPVSVLGPDVDAVLSPDVTPSYGRSKDKGEDRGRNREKREKKGPKVRAKNKGGQEKEVKAAVRKGRAKDGSASENIGKEGGFLVFGEHTLYVPAGAVDGDTRFMIREAEHRVGGMAVLALDLHANRGRGRNAVDVGEAGFKVPVVLCVGISDVDDEIYADDEAALIWYRPSGDVMEATDAYHNGNGQFCGELDHFSLWGLAWP